MGASRIGAIGRGYQQLPSGTCRIPVISMRSEHVVGGHVTFIQSVIVAACAGCTPALGHHFRGEHLMNRRIMNRRIALTLTSMSCLVLMSFATGFGVRAAA